MAIAPVAAQAAGSKGRSGTVVVDWRASSNTATIASRSGTLQAVHTTSPAKVGAVVRKSKVRHLFNGTVAADLSQVGRAGHARVRGKVVAVIGKTVAISAPGTTFMIKIKRSGKRSNEVTPSTPVVGSTVAANVNIAPDGSLVTNGVTQVAAPNPQATVEIEGTVSAVDVAGRKITVNTSDDGVVASFVVLIGDPAIDINMSYTVGIEVELRVIKNPDGTFTLMASSQNGDDDEADDEHRCRSDHRQGQYDSRRGGFGRGGSGKGDGNGGGRGRGRGGDDN
jgi:hypothetical protein